LTFVKGIVLITDASGLTALWEVVIADVGVSLLAILKCRKNTKD